MREVTATVLENVRIAENIYQLTFALDEEIKIRPGQFCMIGVHGFLLKRPFAICKAERERITVGYCLKGEGTKSLASDYRNGEKLSVLLPLGNGFSARDDQKRIALLGGGAGVFPLVSAMKAYEDREVYAFLGFKNKGALCMDYEFSSARQLFFATDDGSLGQKGSIVDVFSKETEKLDFDVVFACGPKPMLKALKNAVEGKRFQTFVSLEERMGCGVGACLVCVCDLTNGEHARVCKDGPVFDIHDVILE